MKLHDKVLAEIWGGGPGRKSKRVENGGTPLLDASLSEISGGLMIGGSFPEALGRLHRS